MTVRFLSRDEVEAFHAVQLGRFGGATGLRDPGLLASALAQPEATFDGEFLHPDVPSMAAAYLFHIVQNQPFMDGNRRTGLLAALVFLELNGLPLPGAQLYETVMAVAQGDLSKAQLAARLRALVAAGP